VEFVGNREMNHIPSSRQALLAAKVVKIARESAMLCKNEK
jgi:hypothetical protein